MNSEDILTKYKEQILNVSRADLDIAEINQGLRELSDAIADDLMIDNFIMTEEVINGHKCIKFMFTQNDYVCSAALKIDYANLLRDLADYINYIVNGIEAINIINNELKTYISDKANGYELEVQWGFGKYCSLAYWDYDNAVIRLSKEAVLHIVDDYTNGESAFSQKIKDLMSDEFLIQNIVDLIHNFNEYKISTYMGAKLPNVSLQEILSKNMMQPNDAINIIMQNRNCNATQNIIVLNIVNQLGSFAILQNWKVDYRNKTVSTNIIDNKILDLDDGTVVTNESICMRIEHLIDLDESTVVGWFE